MAELLIKAQDAIHPDPIKDLRGCYKKGDVGVIMPDGWRWGKEELNKDKFYILKVPDKTPEELEFLTEADEIVVGTRYIAEVPELGISISGPDETGVAAACENMACLLYTSPSPRDLSTSRMPSSA